MSEQLPAQLRYKLFAVGAIGTYMATLDGSIVNVALPTIATSLQASVDAVAWVVLAYSLTLISLMMVFGAWVRKRGYAFGYRFGYVMFLIGSLLCSVSQDLGTLVLGRVVQAVGTAMFAAIGPGMVTTVFGSKERGKGIGMMVAMVSLGFMTGPPLGGLLLGIWSWRSIFLINIPVGLVGLWMTGKYFRRFVQEKSDEAIGVRSAVVLSVSLVAAVFAIKMLNRWAFDDYRTLTLVGVWLVALFYFFRLERNPDTALIGLGIFRNKVFTNALTAQQCHFLGVSGVFILVPFYLERIRGFEPKQVGLFLVIVPIMMGLLSPLTGRLSDRVGYRLLTSLGMATMALALFLLTRLTPESSTAYIVLCLGIGGTGIGLFSSPNSSALMGSVRDDQLAVTSSILATNRNIGHSMGVAVATALFSMFEKKNAALIDPKAIFMASYRPVIYVAIAVALVGIVLCLLRPEQSNKSVDSDR